MLEKEKQFSEWFNTMLDKAELMDVRYPVKGLYVWLPYGLKIRNNVIHIIKNILNKYDHQESLFPLLIPEDEFRKEAEHIIGFEEEVYWVTHGGAKKLDKKLALRPTSETAIYPMLSLWIRSHADLPLKIYQIVNIFRYETKHTRPLIRLREVTTFKEAHTAHATWEEAEEQVQEATQIYGEIFDQLGIPFVVTRRPEWDKFAGAVYSLAFDTIMPDKKTLQIGTAHNLGQTFGKAFEITYETPDGKQEYVYQTCYGISERVIAATIAIHGDDRGLVLLPEIAPIQIVIVPIPYAGKDEPVTSVARSIQEMLVEAGYRTHLDDRDIRPGRKYYDWETKGVPLRIEVGPKDVEKEQVTLVPRDIMERKTLPQEKLPEEIGNLLEKLNTRLKKKAKQEFEGATRTATDLEGAKKKLKKYGGIVKIFWCGKASCGAEIEDATDADILGTPIGSGDNQGTCPVCGEAAETVVYVARPY